jgi:hypothetical protein
MSHYGTLQDFRFSEKDADDIRGSHLYGISDEKLGKISDVIFDHVTGDIEYVVVDTGGWLSSDKFIVPATSLRPSSAHEDDYEAGLTKQQIEAFPPYQEKDVQSDKNWAEYQNRYRSNWETGPVMHRVGTDRNITPTTSQMTSGSGATGRPLAGTGHVSAADSAAAAAPSVRIVPPAADSVTIANSASGIGDRWDTFQSRLRARRKEAAVGCKTCTSGPASERSAESVATQRKAV